MFVSSSGDQSCVQLEPGGDNNRGVEWGQSLAIIDILERKGHLYARKILYPGRRVGIQNLEEILSSDI